MKIKNHDSIKEEVSYNSLTRMRDSLITMNLFFKSLSNSGFNSLKSSFGSLVNVLKRITPYVGNFNSKINLPKSKSFVIRILLSFSALARTFLSSSPFITSVTKIASYPSCVRRFVKLLPKFSSTRNLIPTSYLYYRKYLFATNKFFCIKKCSLYIFFSNVGKIFHNFFIRLSNSDSMNYFLNSNPCTFNHRLPYHHSRVNNNSLHEIFHTITYSNYKSGYLNVISLQDYDTKLLQLQVNYTDDSEGKTTYMFSNTSENKHGLLSMQKPWIVLMNYQANDQPLFVTTSRKTLSSIPLKVTADENEAITKLTFNQSFSSNTNLTLAFGYLGTVNTRSDSG